MLNRRAALLGPHRRIPAVIAKESLQVAYSASFRNYASLSNKFSGKIGTLQPGSSPSGSAEAGSFSV